jgi:hypothetical protein
MAARTGAQGRAGGPRSLHDNMTSEESQHDDQKDPHQASLLVDALD